MLRLERTCSTTLLVQKEIPEKILLFYGWMVDLVVQALMDLFMNMVCYTFNIYVCTYTYLYMSLSLKFINSSTAPCMGGAHIIVVTNWPNYYPCWIHSPMQYLNFKHLTFNNSYFHVWSWLFLIMIIDGIKALTWYLDQCFSQNLIFKSD